MRFETPVLTLHAHDIYGVFYRARNYEPFAGFACPATMQRKPHRWDLSNAPRIVLVFSTEPVRGAAITYVHRLKSAGRYARVAHPEARRLLQETRLWWWPEIILEDNARGPVS